MTSHDETKAPKHRQQRKGKGGAAAGKPHPKPSKDGLTQTQRIALKEVREVVAAGDKSDKEILDMLKEHNNDSTHVIRYMYDMNGKDEWSDPVGSKSKAKRREAEERNNNAPAPKPGKGADRADKYDKADRAGKGNNANGKGNGKGGAQRDDSGSSGRGDTAVHGGRSRPHPKAAKGAAKAHEEAPAPAPAPVASKSWAAITQARQEPPAGFDAPDVALQGGLQDPSQSTPPLLEQMMEATNGQVIGGSEHLQHNPALDMAMANAAMMGAPTPDMSMCAVPSEVMPQMMPNGQVPSPGWASHPDMMQQMQAAKISPHMQPQAELSMRESLVNSGAPPHAMGAEVCSNYEHQSSFLLNIVQLWDRRELCDLRLLPQPQGPYPDSETENMCLSVHSVVIAAASSEIRQILGECVKTSGQIPPDLVVHVEPRALEEMVRFMYMGEIRIHDDTVASIMHAAETLSVPRVMEIAVDYLKRNINAMNALSVSNLATDYHRQDLKLAVEGYLLSNISQLVQEPDFLQQPLERITELLGSDEANFQSEVDVFRAVCQWVRHDSSRLGHFPDLLANVVRLPLMTSEQLLDEVEQEELVSNDQRAHGVVLNVYRYQAMPEARRGAMDIAGTRMRNPQMVPYQHHQQ